MVRRHYLAFGGQRLSAGLDAVGGGSGAWFDLVLRRQAGRRRIQPFSGYRGRIGGLLVVVFAKGIEMSVGVVVKSCGVSGS